MVCVYVDKKEFFFYIFTSSSSQDRTRTSNQSFSFLFFAEKIKSLLDFDFFPEKKEEEETV